MQILQVAETLKNSSEKYPLEFSCSSFTHSSFRFPLLCRLCNKRFVPLAARTLVWSPAIEVDTIIQQRAC